MQNDLYINLDISHKCVSSVFESWVGLYIPMLVKLGLVLHVPDLQAN